MEGTEVGNLIVRLTGNGASYQNMLRGAVTQSTGAVQQLSASTVMYGNLAASVLMGLGRKMMQLGRQALGGWGEAELAEVKLRAMLEANGKAVDSTMARYKAFADQMQDVTTQEDDAVIAMLQTAETMGITGEAAERVIKNAIGMGEAFGIGAQGAVRMAAGLEQGNVDRLGRYFPILRSIKDPIEKVAKANELLAKSFAVAEAVAGTFSGSMTRMKVAVGNAWEEIGKVFAAWLQPMIEGVRDFSRWFTKLSDATKRWVAIVMASLAVITLLPIALMVLSPIIGLVTGAFGLLFSSIRFILTPLGAVTAAVVLLGTMFVDWKSLVSPILGWFKEKWQELARDIQPALDAMVDALAAGNVALAAEIFWLQLQKIWLEQTRVLSEIWLSFVNWMAKTLTEAWPRVETWWTKLKAVVQAAWSAPSDFGWPFKKGAEEAYLKNQVKIFQEADEALAAIAREAERNKNLDWAGGLAEQFKARDDRIEGLKERLKGVQIDAAMERMFSEFEEGVKEVGEAAKAKPVVIPYKFVEIKAAEFGSMEASARIAKSMMMRSAEPMVPVAAGGAAAEEGEDMGLDMARAANALEEIKRLAINHWKGDPVTLAPAGIS
jgi:hypothetical protein